MDNENILGFSSFITEHGERHYGCRGFGIDYDYFYNKFIIGKSYRCVSENFPWDYFIFTNIKDEQEFLNKYSSKIDYHI